MAHNKICTTTRFYHKSLSSALAPHVVNQDQLIIMTRENILSTFYLYFIRISKLLFFGMDPPNAIKQKFGKVHMYTIVSIREIQSLNTTLFMTPPYKFEINTLIAHANSARWALEGFILGQRNRPCRT